MNEEKTEKDEINDAFLLKSTDPATKKKRAILGNGYFGCDVSNNFGQGFGLSEIKDPFPIMYLGGVYGASLNPSEREHGKLDAIFRPLNNFSLIPDKQDPMDVYSSLEKDSYIQTLDMKNAIVQTKGQWDDYFINTEMFLCRNFIHFGILRLEITPTEGKIGDFK